MAYKTTILILLFFCLLSFNAYSQDNFKFEVFGAYSLMQAHNPDDSVSLRPTSTIIATITGKGNHQYQSGFTAGIAYNINPNIGIVGKFGRHQSSGSFLETSFEDIHYYDYWWTTERLAEQQTDFSMKRYALLAGPRFSIHLLNQLRPFAQVLIGWDRNSIRSHQRYLVQQSGSIFTGPASTNFDLHISANREINDSFAVSYGGGLDIRLNERFSIRLFEVEVLNSREIPVLYTARATDINTEPSSIVSFNTDIASAGVDDNRMNSIRLSFGVVLHFGK